MPGCGCPPIPGIGNFEKEGTGNLILSGINTYTGTTAVNGGMLAGRRLDRLVERHYRELPAAR